MRRDLILKPAVEIAFGPYGGAELFFADIDGDARPEILAYQGPAVFGASLYANLPSIRPALPQSVCLSAFSHDGKRLWTWGEPNPTDRPYISHAFESCVAAGDVDGDGRVEVILADGRTVHVLDGPTGQERASATLPHDNFCIAQVLGEPTGENEAAFVLKNGEGGYDDWRYGEPLIAFNSHLKPVWGGPVAIPGAGHHILSLDLDADGQKEYLIGYCAVKADGHIAWILDCIDPAELDPSEEHVDYTDVRRLSSGEMVLAFAGSDKIYLASQGGRTLFVRSDTHVQGCALGRFRDDAECHVAVYNDDGPLVLYDREGQELWRQATPLFWPLGMPNACQDRVFHRNRPVVTYPYKNRDWIVVTDGGWPWGIDGEGEITLRFEAPPASRQPERELPEGARADDLGYGFATQALDWDGDGNLEALIYDRRYLWVFRPVG